MKQEIPPTYHKTTKITCVCGHSFNFGGTQPELQIDICSNCHPFYTGKEKRIDSAGRIEKFKAKSSKVSTERVNKKTRKEVKKTKKGISKKIKK